jgi:penicillin-binding protein 1C
MFARARAVARLTLRMGLALLALLLVGVGVASWILGPAPIKAAAPSSKLVVDREGRLLRAFATVDGRWRLPVTVEEVDQRYLALLLAFEDRRFHKHGGIDYRAMGRAVWQFLSSGRPVSGGSTLTMQLARIIESEPTHSLKAKFKQLFRAYELERKLGKKKILELYLKVAPYGGNVEGVRAAALAYFGKEPKRLSLAEAATLVALPQSPEQRRPDRSPDAARRGRNRVLELAAKAGVITAAEARQAQETPLGAQRHEFPTLAAHLAERVIAESPEAQVIRLTINRDLQESLEALTARRASAMGSKLSAAVMIVDHKTGEVLAHVGSPSYFDDSRLGAIDMTEAVRSPGSALKPFIYGLGFETRLAHPETLIEDSPARFAGYAPKNFDGKYHGVVTVREALQQSLNLPAVKMLAAVGPSRLAARFHRAGMSIDMPRNLAVALGGVGLRLSDLAVLYTALARGGRPIALRYLVDKAHPDSSGPQPLLSPLASWQVTGVLRGSPAPDHGMDGAIAFKTGTSYGYRDAWAAGFDGRHLAVAWAGRADGSSTPGLTGLASAAPLAFDALALLGPARAPFAPPPEGSVVLTTADLPPPLRYFREQGQDAAAADPTEPALKIAFPPDKAELEIESERSGAPSPLALKAEGGVPPLTWLVNGVPLSSTPFLREAEWTPQEKGVVQVSVIDAKGRVDKVNVRLR